MSDISYTPDEVANILQISRFTVYEMIKRGELQAYRVGRKLRIEPSAIAAYKNQSKEHNCQNISKTVEPAANTLIICGQDTVLNILARCLEKKNPHISVLRSYIGSINSLLALYQGKVHVATAHLWDGDTGDFNTPYVRRLLPGQRVSIFNLFYRKEGFYVAKGNPLNLKTWNDLIRPDIRLINRELGSGARVLLDEHLRKLDINPNSIPGYENEQSSHVAVASCIARGEANVGIGSEQGAMQVQNVDFIPLINERYDIIVKTKDLEKPVFQSLIHILKTKEFQEEINGIGIYNTNNTGTLIKTI